MTGGAGAPGPVRLDRAPDPLDRAAAQFPRVCSSCGFVYESFADFAELTTPVGVPQHLDPGGRTSDPSAPFELICYSNCRCGSTLALCCSVPARTRGEPHDPPDPPAPGRSHRAPRASPCGDCELTRRRSAR